MNKSTQQVKLERVKGDPRAGREVAGDAGNKRDPPLIQLVAAQPGSHEFALLRPLSNPHFPGLTAT